MAEDSALALSLRASLLLPLPAEPLVEGPREATEEDCGLSDDVERVRTLPDPAEGGSAVSPASVWEASSKSPNVFLRSLAKFVLHELMTCLRLSPWVAGAVLLPPFLDISSSEVRKLDGDTWGDDFLVTGAVGGGGGAADAAAADRVVALILGLEEALR